MSKFNRILFRSIFLAATFSMVVGCVSAKYIERKQYLLVVNSPVNKSTIGKTRVFINPVKVITPFDRLDFLYRVSNTRYLVDYYHVFMVNPATQIRDLFNNYLRADASISADQPLHTLQLELSELYADYRDNLRPKAVVKIRAIVVDEANRVKKILFDKSYNSRLLLSQKNTDALLDSWSKGLESIFRQLVIDINRLSRKSNA